MWLTSCYSTQSSGQGRRQRPPRERRRFARDSSPPSGKATLHSVRPPQPDKAPHSLRGVPFLRLLRSVWVRCGWAALYKHPRELPSQCAKPDFVHLRPRSGEGLYSARKRQSGLCALGGLFGREFARCCPVSADSHKVQKNPISSRTLSGSRRVTMRQSPVSH